MTDENSGVQPDGVGTMWLYKQHDLLLGPLSYEEMVRQIEEGLIGGDTPACQQGSGDDFVPISMNPLFMVALARAGARNKVEAQQRVEASSRRKAAGMKVGLIALASIIGLGAIGVGASYLAIKRPWERKVDLPDPIITDELPVIALSSRRGAGDDEGMFYPSGTSGKGQDKAGQQAADGSAGNAQGKATASASSSKGQQKKPERAAATQKAKDRSRSSEKDGLASQQEWDEDAIQDIVAKKKKTLHPCLIAETHRQSESNPAWSARIPMEFTVANNGKVAKLWIDHPDYKDKNSELYKCMFKTLGTWKFPAYSGEQANVSIAFNVQAR